MALVDPVYMKETEGLLEVPGNTGTSKIYPGNKGKWPKLKGNKGTLGNRGQVKSSLSILLTIDLKNMLTKPQDKGGFLKGTGEL